MKLETDAKKIKDGMAFKIGKKFYLKVGKRAVKLDPSDCVDFESLIKNNGNEINYIFRHNGNVLYKKEEK